MQQDAAVAKVVTRIYVEHPLAEDIEISLELGTVHRLRSVLRQGVGALVALFNDRDGEWLAEVTQLSKFKATARLLAPRRPSAEEPDVWLLFAPLKKQSVDFLVEKACELGASRLLPVFTQYTNATRVNEERLAAHCKEAAEQCERLSLTRVAKPRKLDQVLADWPQNRRLLVCAEFGEARPLAAVLIEAQKIITQKYPPVLRDKWAVLVGPEGGFSVAELERMKTLDFVTAVGLGPRILRADTAALSVLASWQAILGDGGHRPPPSRRER